VRVVFCGTPSLAVPTLAAVAQAHEIAAVVCQPDRPKGRSKRPVPPPVKAWALEHGIPVHQPEKLNDGAFAAWLEDLVPEIGVLVAYGRILKAPILAAPRHGWLNMHPSLLPRWRGPSPIQSALLHGDNETGVSIMQLSEEMDAGDVLLQQASAIGVDENHISLSERLSLLGAEMMVEALELVATGKAPFSPQDESLATYCQLIRKEDGRIRWADTAEAIHNLVRASVPWPVAHCLYEGEVFRIHEARALPESTSATPGTVIGVEKDRFVVATGEGALEVLAVQAPGKRIMTSQAFLLGHGLAPGARFEDMD